MDLISSRFRRFLLFWAIFIVILFAMNSVFTHLVLLLDHNEAKVVEVFGLKNNNIDILIMGDSLVQQGVNPAVIDEVLGTKSYNMAIGGASALESALILAHYLERNPPPRLVVFGVSLNREAQANLLRPTVLQNLSVIQQSASYDFLSSVGQKRNLLQDWGSLLPVYKFRSMPKRLGQYLLYHSDFEPKWIQGHYSLVNSSFSLMRYPPHKAGLNQAGLAYLVSLFRQYGIKFLLIECPNMLAYNESVVGRDEVLAGIQKICGNDTCFVSLNSSDLSFEEEDWFSLNHLSGKGAIKLSTRMAPLLKQALKQGEDAF